MKKIFKDFTEAELITSMSELGGWKEVVKPFLEQRRNQSYPNPLEFTDEKNFLYAAKTASIFKNVITEILDFAEGKKK